MNVCNLFFANENEIKFDLNRFDFIDDKGFAVKSMICDGVEINTKEINFPKFTFITDRTYLRESLRFKFDSFDDFNQFEQKVELSANLISSKVYFGDLMHFVKKLNSSSFFIQNKKQTS